MSDSPSFYIIKRPTGICEIVTEQPNEIDDAEVVKVWGPYSSTEEAIARRVGLIRAGKCQPV